jgi:beta-lactam-binding protein with PASTA domain
MANTKKNTNKKSTRKTSTKKKEKTEEIIKDIEEKDVKHKEYDENEKTETMEMKMEEDNVKKDSHEINNVISNEINNHKPSNRVHIEKYKHPFADMFLVLVLIGCIAYFFVNIACKPIASFTGIINILLITLFSIIFVGIGLSINKKSKSSIVLCGLILLAFFMVNTLDMLNIVKVTSVTRVENFTGRSLVDVVKWAELNNVELDQEYEYSDMVDDYRIISQSVKAGTKVDGIKTITVAVSEGPNPSKEIIIPSMIGWDSERVINFVHDNYLSNVEVEFVLSEKQEDTVIEQNITGNAKRNDNIKLTFSIGEEYNDSEIKLIDFTNKSKFEVDLYMKKNRLNYNTVYDFSNKIKRDYAFKQSLDAGTMISPNNEEAITITLSKGKKVKVPNLTKMSMTEITNWVIKNRLKVEFNDKYDDSVKENDVISADKSAGDIIEQGTVIKVVISKGSLKMPKFKSFNDFRDWADKYGIRYEIKNEFSSSVKDGEVINYSYKTGEVIKNDDTIIVTLSSGEKVTMPKVVGLTKSQATSRLNDNNINYSFVYSPSDEKKDIVINQSIRAGSEISKNTTVTVTLSNGKKATQERQSNSNNKPNSNSNNSSNNNNNGGGNTTPSCVKKTCTVPGTIKSQVLNDPSYNKTVNWINNWASSCSGLKYTIRAISGDTPGFPHGIYAYMQVETCGQTYVFEVEK